MLNVPRDIIENAQHIHIKPADLFAVRLLGTDISRFHDILQTMHCLELVYSGEIKVYHGQSAEVLKKSQIQFRKKGNYQLCASDDFSSLVIFINNDFIKHFLVNNYTSSYEKSINHYQSYHIFRSTAFIDLNRDEVIRQINNPTQYSAHVIRTIAEQIMLQLLTLERNSFLRTLYDLTKENKIDLCYFMESHFTNQLSLKQLAEATGRSLTVFKNEFSQVFKTTPVRWLTNRRLEHADHLLRCTDDPISQIAYANGFNNISHFSKVYKLKFGVNATQARKRYYGNIC